MTWTRRVRNSRRTKCLSRSLARSPRRCAVFVLLATCVCAQIAVFWMSAILQRMGHENGVQFVAVTMHKGRAVTPAAAVPSFGVTGLYSDSVKLVRNLHTETLGTYALGA